MHKLTLTGPSRIRFILILKTFFLERILDDENLYIRFWKVNVLGKLGAENPSREEFACVTLFCELLIAKDETLTRRNMLEKNRLRCQRSFLHHVSIILFFTAFVKKKFACLSIVVITLR